LGRPVISAIVDINAASTPGSAMKPATSDTIKTITPAIRGGAIVVVVVVFDVVLLVVWVVLVLVLVVVVLVLVVLVTVVTSFDVVLMQDALLR
jgi:hypothetical protein